MFTPKTKCELVALVREELIALDEIDVNLITDMSYMFYCCKSFNKVSYCLPIWSIQSPMATRTMTYPKNP
ncbi:hypothetical protein [Campylobacter subantarcticus]|uniref:Uncharacterized protein n=1 Tax=Campylobacter subantarcticus LMG 24374 TaxID=1388751 RepID=A0A0A8HB80_9BACT|nr:hypothetical protein [Campylobacter subantarcticus]AJC90174.1 hypothetical protein CSUB8521_0281 [Campylobacter subantarcticus LMG 24374]EAJ1261267.1 hypothetical protein [Campylobacter lari]